MARPGDHPKRPSTPEILDAIADDKVTFEPIKGSLGGGVNGMTGLCHLIVDDSRRLAVVKNGDQNEVNLLVKVKDVEEVATPLYAEAIDEKRAKPTHASTAATDSKEEEDTKNKKYRIYISACELGSLQAQKLQERVTAGEINRKAYLAYVFQVISRINHALKEAHAAGVLHLDIKPLNVFIAADGKAYLGDFGYGVECSPGEKVSAGKRMTDNGTVYYSTPEACTFAMGNPSERLSVSAQTDTWALGCMLGELLGPKHEVALVSHKEAEKKVGPIQLLFASGMAASKKEKSRPAWEKQCRDAQMKLEEIADLDDPLEEEELVQALDALAIIMTAPVDMRPDSITIEEYINRLQPLIPDVTITTAVEGGRPRIATITEAPRFTATAEAGEEKAVSAAKPDGDEDNYEDDFEPESPDEVAAAEAAAKAKAALEEDKLDDVYEDDFQPENPDEVAAAEAAAKSKAEAEATVTLEAAKPDDYDYDDYSKDEFEPEDVDDKPKLVSPTAQARADIDLPEAEMGSPGSRSPGTTRGEHTPDHRGVLSPTDNILPSHIRGASPKTADEASKPTQKKKGSSSTKLPDIAEADKDSKHKSKASHGSKHKSKHRRHHARTSSFFMEEEKRRNKHKPSGDSGILPDITQGRKP